MAVQSNSLMRDVILELISHLEAEFKYVVASFFFGDPGNFSPNAFIGQNGVVQPIIVISPRYNHVIDGEQWIGGENRLLGLDIMVLVSFINQIEATPTKRPGEEDLLEITDLVFEFLRTYDMVDLHKAVKDAQVSDVDWTWTPRQNQPLRGAVISYEVKVSIAF